MKLCFLLIGLFLNIIILRSQVNLMEVKPWAYQLQNVDISAIVKDKYFKLVVTDYSLNGTDELKFTKQQIDYIKNSGKYAISYISIGEAEDYRFYWKSGWKTNPPQWLGPENPEWLGNYKVRFWFKEWEDIVLGYIDTIISQGFDGIYLDIIDAWYYWAVEKSEKPDADSLMCRFVINIRNYVNSKTGNKNFIIIPQNAEDVIYQKNISNGLRSSYFDAINAIGLEDVFFPGANDENNNYNPDEYRLGVIKNYLSNNKQVYSIEYLTEPAKISLYQITASEKKFIPYSCVRQLNKMCPALVSGFTEPKISDNLFPHPFSSSTKFNYQLSEPNRVKIDIYNSLGEKITTLVDEWQEAGRHNCELRIENYELSAGMYYYTIRIGERIGSGKLLLIK